MIIKCSPVKILLPVILVLCLGTRTNGNELVKDNVFDVFLSKSFKPDKSAERIVGIWITSKQDAKVQIFKRGNSYFGKIIYDKRKNSDASTVRDLENPDPIKRKETILGLEILKNFSYSGDSIWENGTIYDPKTGKTYSCKITLTSENEIKIRGFIGVSLFGRTEIWKRA